MNVKLGIEEEEDLRTYMAFQRLIDVLQDYREAGFLNEAENTDAFDAIQHIDSIFDKAEKRKKSSGI